MKTRMLLPLLFSAIVGIFAGCQKENVSETSQLESQTDHAFPVSLAGRWESDETKWMFVFEKDGSIPRFTHYLGMDFEIEQGGITETGRGGLEATYVLGPCKTEYDSTTNQLKVTAVIEYYIFNFADGAIKGAFHDTFVGKVSDDGKQWNVKWRNVAIFFQQDSFDTEKMMSQDILFHRTEDTQR